MRAAKVRNGADPLVMVTAYDAPGARIASEAGVDLILVGDSVPRAWAISLDTRVLGFALGSQVYCRPPTRTMSPPCW